MKTEIINRIVELVKTGAGEFNTLHFNVYYQGLRLRKATLQRYLAGMLERGIIVCCSGRYKLAPKPAVIGA